MKKLYTTIIVACSIITTSYAQWTQGTGVVYPTTITNKVGIGTTTPNAASMLDVKLGTDQHIQFIANTNGVYSGVPGILSINDANTAYTPLGFFAGGYYFGLGNVGVNTYQPQAKLHVISPGVSSNTISQYSGSSIIESLTGGRSSTTGAALEFVIPANTDGSNPWGQGRIITVAGNAASGDATGKMILGTRRLFDKGTGTGVAWNYGDDLVIDGAGNIGINTTTPPAGYKLAINGSVIATSVTVKPYANWPDYVFKKTYQLPDLTAVKSYIDQNQHLPEMPSAQEITDKSINLGEIVTLQTKKIEELTLYLIDKDKQLTEQQKQIDELKAQLKAITKAIAKN